MQWSVLGATSECPDGFRESFSSDAVIELASAEIASSR